MRGRRLLAAAAIALASLGGPAAAVTQVGPFALDRTDGGRFDPLELDGAPYVVVFGFMRCPDICPTTLNDLTLALRLLGRPGEGLRAFFIDIDPERDGAAALKPFLASFDPRIVGLTGSPAEVAVAVQAFGAAARKAALPDGGYTMEHSAGLFVIDGNGLVVDRIAPNDPPEAIAARLRRAIEGG
ncbi:protein SCO1/2 [Methylopila capsulata]|uniref:Photosynthetic protein synthase I n=1 Tax=Methylopila capsulata TaxID=61654 RepID=A0A9W6MQM2_9HYPH|nr:SCO family protein [Methylopila capsulata]MBM7851345.1 protein SCO1/2 [Methylopila capsulata]GLK54403.1 photosynthetic protein synthase I [Methylopila capsulata]